MAQNIFKLISDDPSKYGLWNVKSKLMMTVSLRIKQLHLTQKEAAEVLGVTQPRISNLIGGKIDKFSTDMLIEYAARLGYDFDVDFNPKDLSNPIFISVKADEREV